MESSESNVCKREELFEKQCAKKIIFASHFHAIENLPCTTSPKYLEEIIIGIALSMIIVLSVKSEKLQQIKLSHKKRKITKRFYRAIGMKLEENSLHNQR